MFQQYYVAKYGRVMTLSPDQAADEELEAELYDPDKHDKQIEQKAAERAKASEAAGDGSPPPRPRAGSLMPGGNGDGDKAQ